MLTTIRFITISAGALLLCAASLPGQGLHRSKTTRPVLRGTQYAVTTRKPQATQVGERILRAGGNAFDAAVAAQAALSITDPASNGVGADAFILVYDAKSEKVYSINAAGWSPKLATIDWYMKHSDGKIPANKTLLASTIPATIDAWYVMLDRWGTMSFEQVLAPAIELAREGFPVSELLAASLRGGSQTYLAVGDGGIEKKQGKPSGNRKLAEFPTSRKIYFPDGTPPRAGEILRNPDLARTLEKLVEAERRAKPEGRKAALKAARDRFYKGDIARHMAKFSEDNGGLFRYEDFAEFSVKVEDAISTRYRGYEVYKNPSANQGPSELFALNILRGYDLKAMGHNSADYIHTSVEAIKLAFADREMFLADEDFVKIPFAGLLSEPYAVARRALIDNQRASTRFRPGNPERHMSGFSAIRRSFEIPLDDDSDHEGDTSYVAVIDRDRNAVSFTPSLHSGFGTGIVMGDTGIIFNCRGDYFWLDPDHPNALEPRKRPRSTLTPTLILKDGKPFMAVGSPGGDDQCMRIMQTFLNVVEFGMNIQLAIEAPRWTTSSFPSSTFPHGMKVAAIGLETRISEEVRAELKKRGHRIRMRGPWTVGATCAIVVDPQTGVLSAGGDPRGDNYALAW